MKFLYVPWRSKYVKSTRAKDEDTEKECVFCEKLADGNDEKHYILGRYKYNAVILNLYPYNTGHTMVVPLRHVKNLTDMKKEERAEFMELISHTTDILQKKLDSHGTNIGINLGKAAGAGVPSHLHLHVLPRWKGDTNFLPLLAETKTISVDLNEMYNNLKPEFRKIKLD